MELLYVWVKEYQNFKNQGFNFNPRYHFTYNPDNNELSLDERPDAALPAGFFGENITNVTAIVGENGAGKSNLINILWHSHFFPRPQIIVTRTNDGNLHNLNSQLQPKTIGFSFTQTSNSNLNTHHIRDSRLRKDPNQLNNEIRMIADFITQQPDTKLPIQLPNCIYFDFMRTFNEVLHKKSINLSLFNEAEDNLIIEKFKAWIAFEIALELDKSGSSNNAAILSEYLGEDIATNALDILPTKIKFKTTNQHIDFSKNNNIVGNIEAINQLLKDITTTFKQFNKKNIESYTSLVNFKFFDNDIRKLYSHIQQIGTAPSEQSNYTLTPFYEFRVSTERYGLSSGEFNLLHLLAVINRRIVDNNKALIPIILTFDEPDTELHPEWQRGLLSKLLTFLTQDKFKHLRFQLIFTTHSPFLLSDIPSGNVIFLKKDATGNCQVVDNALQDNRKTFAANIHSLLADSFFMQNGLIGEFAKGKINEVIDLLNNNAALSADEQTKVQTIISMIGEPIIRHKLTQLYNEKMQFNTDKSLKNHDERIKDLENKIKQLEDKIANNNNPTE